MLQDRVRGRIKLPQLKPLYLRIEGYTAQDATAYWGAVQKGGGIAAEKRLLTLDLLFPLAYGGALFLAAWFYRNSLAGALPVFSLLLVLTDWTENSGLLSELGRFMESGAGSVRPAVIGIASVATMLKLLLLVVCAVLLLAECVSAVGKI
jgi:hypothetical protein